MTRRELVSFLAYQVVQIRTGGLTLTVRKFFKGIRFLMIEFPFYFLALPLLLCIRCLRPFKLVRFGTIGTLVIGNGVFDAEYYLSERELEGSTSLDVFYFSSNQYCNEHWPRMASRKFWVFSFVKYLDVVNKLIPGGEPHIVRLVPIASGSRDIKGVLYQTKHHISFTDDENRRGREFLRSIGLTADETFVCLLVRDNTYKSQHQQWLKSDWSYHDYRNADIDTFREAALTSAAAGHWVFRMGKGVTRVLDVNHPRVIDYANSPHRDDFLDMWLMAHCRYCITTGTGLDDVCVAFRRPLVEVNQLPVGLGRSNQAFTIDLFKYLRWESTQMFLSLDELIETGAITFLRSEFYRELGIEIVNNTSEEIVAAVEEMEGRLNGTWKEIPTDTKLQKLFWKKLKSAPHFPVRCGWIHPDARVSASFLRKNHDWFLSGQDGAPN